MALRGMKRRGLALAGLALAALPVGAMALSAQLERAAPAGNAHLLARDLAGAGWHQIRIEQHVIIRIAPGDPAMARDIPPPPEEPPPERLKQRRMPKCVPVVAIAGVRPLANNRLMLFLRDHRLVGVDLARNCTAQDFYMGFYVSTTSDGLMCAGRDTIHSRAGTTCTIAKVHELVPRN